MTNSIAINVYSVHRELFNDYMGTVEKLSEIGYFNVELISSNFLNKTRFRDIYPANRLKPRFKEWGINLIGMHEMLTQGQDLLAYEWDPVIAYNNELGCPAVVIPWLWFNDRDETLRTAEQLNAIGKRLKENGLQLYYHNHGHDFREVGGTTLFDLLLEHTDPSYLKFQLELVWVDLAGVDPIAVMTKLGDRCDMVHQNDLNKEVRFDRDAFFNDMAQCQIDRSDIMKVYRAHTKTNSFVDLGTGSFDFDSFYKKANSMGHVRYSIVENETKDDEKLKSVERDFKVMQSHINENLQLN